MTARGTANRLSTTAAVVGGGPGVVTHSVPRGQKVGPAAGANRITTGANLINSVPLYAHHAAPTHLVSGLINRLTTGATQRNALPSLTHPPPKGQKTATASNKFNTAPW